VDVEDVVRIFGGVAPWGSLVRVTSRAQVRAAVGAGRIVQVGRGRYALPGAHEALVVAARASGHVCLTSAALAHGWAVKTVPEKPCVALPKHRRLGEGIAPLLTPYWIDLGQDDVEGRCTDDVATLAMCLRALPFDEALTVADSALRAGFPRRVLLDLASTARGPGSAQMRRVAACADGRADNPFESVLRAIALGVDGLSVEPQVVIRPVLGPAVRPDLVDRRRRIVLEADSFEWHGNRRALRRDSRRYDALAVSGWLVLRFAWEDVMHDPAWVRSVLVEAVRWTDRRTA
jgi:very-short-patch-repair endonuclease